MPNETPVHALLAHVRAQEGDAFVCDEEALLSEYRKREEDTSSLAIKILSILGGLLACAAFLGFLAVAGLFDSGPGTVILGAVFIIGAIAVNRKFDKLSVDTMSIALFAAGFAILGFGLSLENLGINGTCMLFIGLAIATLALTQTYALSFLSVLIINISVLVLISHNVKYTYIHVYTSAMAILLAGWMLKEADIVTVPIPRLRKTLSRLYNPIRIGLVFSFLFGLTFLGKRGLFPITYVWASSITTIAAVLYLIYQLCETLHIKPLQHKLIVLGISALALLPTAFSPAISGAILLVLLSFRVNHKTGTAIGILALVYFVSQYYYDLDFTLLVKSGIMFSSGMLFLLFYLLTHKYLALNKVLNETI